MAHAPARTVSTAVVPSRSRGTRSVVSPAVWRAGSVKSFRAGRVHREVRQPTLFDGSASRGRDGGWAPRPRGEPMIDPKCEPQGGGGPGEAPPGRAYDPRQGEPQGGGGGGPPPPGGAVGHGGGGRVGRASGRRPPVGLGGGAPAAMRAGTG